MHVVMDINREPALPQRQDSTAEQLRDLYSVANRMGMYDAADAIRPLFIEPKSNGSEAPPKNRQRCQNRYS